MSLQIESLQSMVVLNFNSTWEAQAGSSLGVPGQPVYTVSPGQPGLQSATPRSFKKKKKKASIWEMEAEELEFKVSLSYTSKFLTGPDFMTRSLKKNKNKTQPLNDVVEEEVGR